jgi:hypothetical protein
MTGGTVMIHTVDVPLVGADIAAAMAEMREWLDHHRCEPDGFHHVTRDQRLTCCVDFKLESEAAAFARAFSGRLRTASRTLQGKSA